MSRARRALIAILSVAVPPLLLAACVSLDLKEATQPFVGRKWNGAPTIAVAEVHDRRTDRTRFGRVGWNSLKIKGDAGAKFRNSLMSEMNERGFNIRFVGPVNVLDIDAVAQTVRDAKADFLLTAAVLDIRLYSTDPFFDPADVDFTAQVNLLDPDGRTVYTRHLHTHEDKRLWFNPAFGARDMLDLAMDRVAQFVATDAELVRVVKAPRAPAVSTAAAPAPAAGGKPISSTEPVPSTAEPASPPAEAPPAEPAPAEAPPPALDKPISSTEPLPPSAQEPVVTIPLSEIPPDATLSPGEEAVPSPDPSAAEPPAGSAAGEPPTAEPPPFEPAPPADAAP